MLPGVHRRLGRVAKRLFRQAWREDQLAKPRTIRFEPLETRQLMAADFFASAGLAAESNGVNQYLSSTSDVGTLTAEGEPAPDLVAFAKALTDAGVIFFGADWCPFCRSQKLLFEDGADFLNFVEVTNPDRTRNARGIAENVTTYPTWQFQNGSRLTGELTLQQISTASGIAIPTSSRPSIAPIANATVLRGSPLHIPVDAYDPNGNPLTITVSSSNPSAVTAEVLSGNSSARMDTNFGVMVFELFDTEGGRAASRFKQLAQSGFYNTSGANQMIFHRVIENFVIQGGDPTGTGTGGSSFPDFDDQFNLNLQHNRSGVLSYAKSSDDTNDSQFFVTAGPTRNLDFNHSIFGQLVEGDAARRGIARTAVNSSDKPINNVIINSVTIFDDVENGLVRLRAVGAVGASSTITVTARDTEGNETSQVFTVAVANDTSNGSPFLNDIAPVSAVAGQPITVQLTAQDKEGDTLRFSATRPSNQTVNYTVNANQSTGLVTITPPANFVGSFQFLAGVNQTPNANANDQNDTQLVTVNVTAAAPSAPTAIDLSSASDSGASNSDNITNAGTLTFTVSGTTSGATVTLRAGSNVIGTQTATGSTTTITTSNLAALGAGTYQISATQTVDSQVSAASPSLALTFDNTAPIALSSNPFPASIPANQALSVNLTHPEEGAGLVYSLNNAPAGMTVNSSTGVVSWTPTPSQVGSHSFSLVMTDTAGNLRTDNFTIAVAEAALAGIRLQLLDVNNNPISSVSVGQSFKLRVIADDLRTTGASGVFSAYMDLNYDTNLVELDGANPITRLNSFDVTPSGTTTTAGLIDELGAARGAVSASNLQSIEVLEIRFRAKAAGQANFTTDAAETANRSFLLYDIDTAVPTPRIAFGTASLSVGRNFTANNDSINVNEDSSNTTINVLANDTINSGTNTTLTIASVGSPNAGGSVTIASDNRSLRYTPAANYNGGETFTYVVRDNNGAEATATVTVQVQPVNDPPVAVADVITVTEGSTDNFIQVLLNDNDGVDDNETLTVSAIGTLSAGGSARINGASNGILYTPRTGFTGTETFTYTLRDNNGGTATANVTVTVNPRVPPPTAVNDSFSVVEDANAAEFDVLANDQPSQTGETLTVTRGSGNQGGTVTVTSNNQRLVYSPRRNFVGTELVTYTLEGSRGGITTGTVTFTVTGVNDPPDAVNDSLTVLSQPNQSLDVLANDVTVDSGETLTITAITQPGSGQGTVVLENGQLKYTAPNTNFTGTVSFTYTIGDGSSLTDTATVTLTVRNFIPRSIGGLVAFEQTTGSSAASSMLAGFPIEYRGLSETGENIVRTATVGMNGAFAVEQLPPGTYNVSVPDLPFVTPSSGPVQVVSRSEDGNSSSLRLQVGTIEARYIDVRDFLGRAIGRGITAAIANGQSQNWATTNGAWNQFRSVSLSLNNDGSLLQIQATNANNQVVNGNVPVSDANRVAVRATEGNARLIRLLAHPDEVTLTPVTSSSATSASSQAEGEAGATTDAALAQLDQILPGGSELDSLAEGEGNRSSADYDSVYSQDLDDLQRRRLASDAT